ncbi:hypothetical protein GIB67_013635 [Kingdonia uniflora]|uniref:Trichome birefringence-like N-terminal domain-containing protein n=1 Tax=Kingdonia uniflora TaxID=39325 RepID=A0A7J7NPU0_9MAGN|nr:hypothetical protein GIB67_013635 [Kingdonia uniflora]
MAVVCITNLESKISEKHAYHVSITQAFVEMHLKSVLEVRRSLNHELLIRYDDPIEVMKFSIDFFGFLTELGRNKLIQDLCSQTESWSNNLIDEEFWVSNRDTFLQISLDVVLDTLLRESEELTMKLELDIVATVHDYADPGVVIITLTMDSKTTTNPSGTTPSKTDEGRDKICPICLDYYAEGKDCDYVYGKWVRDEMYAVESYSEDCLFLDPGFQCGLLGRKDDEYRKWRWQPHGCDLPRNQWVSLLCMLERSMNNASNSYEENGKSVQKDHKVNLSVRFHDYNLTVQYYRDTFLVLQDRRPKNYSEPVKGIIKVNTIHGYWKKWMRADVLVFNSGHWWQDNKIADFGLSFQEGETVNMTMDIREAYRRGGPWNVRGECNTSTAPQTDFTKLQPEPWYNQVIHETIQPIKVGNRSVLEILNITYLAEFRIDGHPSVYREPDVPNHEVQDCSHWCLPGVPDSWNELLYAHLFSKDY